MRVLHSWLRELVPFDLDPAVLAERLSLLGLELEGMERFGEKYRGFVVGEVLSKEKHPKADRLSLCTVGTGAAVLRVVCGAPNVAPGQRVVLGTAGAVVPRNQHDPEGRPFTLGAVEVRGVRSEGMICSAYELDLGDDRDGIMVLPASARVGQPLAGYLGLDDTAYDLENTANRPDWLSHIGVAREIGTFAGRAPRLPAVRLTESAEPADRHLAVTVENPDDCPRFAARVLRGIRMTPSPGWMQERLRRLGLRPRNAVVDVTNYVMLECGQPLHAFDAARLRGGRIVVRRAGTPKPFTTLDGKEHTLPADAVMVCDAEREVSIAGIMGGANSDIGDGTTDIVLESACWNPSAIRRTRRALGIVTDASQRFERGADPNATDYALHRAAQLIRQIAGGEILRGAVDVYPRPIAPRQITLRPARVNGILGTNLRPAGITSALRRLGLPSAAAPGGARLVSVPTYRVDLEREIDLIEEVARVVGYDAIPVQTAARVAFAQTFPVRPATDPLRHLAAELGYREAATLSLQSEARARLGGGAPVLLRNSQNQEMAALRTSLIPGLLDVVALNLNRGNTDLRLFEIGHVFERGEAPGAPVPGYRERRMLAFVATGAARPAHWSEPSSLLTAFDLKGDISDLLEACRLDKRRLIPYSTPDALADPALAVETEGRRVGYLGAVRSGLLKSMGIEQEVFIAEVECEALLAQPERRRYRPIPRFPRVRRDLAFLLDTTVPAGDVEAVIRSAAGPLLHRVELFDVFAGTSLPSGKRSLAFALEFMSYERTLTEGEVDTELRRVVQAVEQACGGVLRSV